jgi:hypothetical protein
MVGRVTKVEMTFLYQWKVGVGRSGEDDRRRDKILLKDKAEISSSS